jgi:hypothetical protein
LYPAAGTVTFNGIPVPGANVSFIPQDPDGESAVGVTGADGRFELTTGNRGSGARRGKYTVLVAKLELPTSQPGDDTKKALTMSLKPHDVLPPKYADPKETPFKDIAVPQGGNVNLVLDLQEITP